MAAALSISIEALQLDLLFPIESDVVSLEYDHVLKEEGMEGTPSQLISTCARSLLKLQDICGKIPRIQSLGRLGEEVLQKLLNQSVDEYLAQDETIITTTEDEEAAAASSSADNKLPDNRLAMMLIDRKVDMVTPMVSPLTYEGFLDEVVGIDCGYVQM
jgi:hypothetical protein